MSFQDEMQPSATFEDRNNEKKKQEETTDILPGMKQQSLNKNTRVVGGYRLPRAA